MKYFILSLLLYSSFTFAQLKSSNNVDTAISLQTELKTLNNGFSKFSLKDIMTNQKSLENFIEANISIIKPESSEQISEFINQNTQNLFIHKYTKETPLLSEFTFQAMNQPKSLAKFLGIFFMVNQMLIFAVFILFSMVISHYLGELKYKYPAMSIKRITYSIFRFGFINGIRFWVFSFLFLDNIKPIGQIYIASIESVQSSYPLLYTITSVLSESV